MLRFKSLAFLTLALPIMAVRLSAFDLVVDGIPVAAIVVPDKATVLEKEAAQKLSDYIEKASGAELPVFSESDKPARPLISIGRTQMARKVGISESDLAFDGYHVAVKDETLYLFGRDQEIMTPPGQGGRVGAQGTLRAVFGFLETLGFRWLQPTDRGTHVPPLATIRVPVDLNSTYKPPFMYVAGRMYTWGDWSLANSFRKAARIYSTGGHTWDEAVPETLWEKHPEYFRMQGGQRVRPTRMDLQLCPSNPAVVQRIIDYTQSKFDEGNDIVALGQPDGWKACECENCKKLGWGATVTDQVHITQRKVVEAMRAKYSDRYVHLIIYGPTQTPPISFKSYPANLMVELAPPTEENLSFWRQIAPGGETVYLYDMGIYQSSGIMPKFTPAAAQRGINMLLKNGVKGIYYCGGGENWGAEGPTYYTIGRLATDPTLQWQNILDEYCALTFGKAGKTMRAFYDVLYRRIDTHYAPEGNGADNHTSVFAPEPLDQLGNLLKLAKSQAEGDTNASGWIRLAEISLKHSSLVSGVYYIYRNYQLNPTSVNLKAVGDAVSAYRAFVGELAALPKTDPEFVLHYFPNSSYWTTGDFVENHGTFATNFGKLNAPFQWDFDVLYKTNALPGASRPEAVITRVKSPPVISDGSSDEVWKDVPWLDLRQMALGESETRGRVKIAYDDEKLYFKFECDEPRIEQMVVTSFGRDGKVFNTECVEIMLSPDGFGQKRLQFALSPTQEGKWDGRFGYIGDPLNPLVVDGLPESDWNPQYRHTFKIDKEAKKWTVEMAVSFAELGVASPFEGTRWRGNFGRERHTAVWNQEYQDKEEYLLWSPNLQGTAFPDPSAFGDLYFGKIPHSTEHSGK